MKRLPLICLVLGIFPFWTEAQSIMTFQAGTTIEVQSGADICADSIDIAGSYTGGGTKCGGTLPVELAALRATANNRSVSIQWTTATEVNSFGFEVERALIESTNPTTWQTIGFVKSAGATSSPKQYSFTDNHVSPGRYSYRLKQIDNNGSFSYSATTNIEVALPKEFALEQNFPNPFNPTTTIQYALPKEAHVTLAVYNTLGQKVADLVNEDKRPGYFDVQFDASRLSSGAYIYRIQAGGFVQTRKLVVIK